MLLFILCILTEVSTNKYNIKVEFQAHVVETELIQCYIINHDIEPVWTGDCNKYIHIQWICFYDIMMQLIQCYVIDHEIEPICTEGRVEMIISSEICFMSHLK